MSSRSTEAGWCLVVLGAEGMTSVRRLDEVQGEGAWRQGSGMED